MTRRSSSPRGCWPPRFAVLELPKSPTRAITPKKTSQIAWLSFSPDSWPKRPGSSDSCRVIRRTPDVRHRANDVNHQPIGGESALDPAHQVELEPAGDPWWERRDDYPGVAPAAQFVFDCEHRILIPDESIHDATSSRPQELNPRLQPRSGHSFRFDLVPHQASGDPGCRHDKSELGVFIIGLQAQGCVAQLRALNGLVGDEHVPRHPVDTPTSRVPFPAGTALHREPYVMCARDGRGLMRLARALRRLVRVAC